LLTRVVIPIAIVLLPCAAVMAYYNWRVTNSALTVPYWVHERQYMAAPLFYFQQTPVVPVYRHEQMRQFHELGAGTEWQQHRTFGGFLKITRENIATIAPAYGRPLPIAIALLSSLLMLRRRLTLLALLVCIGLPVIHMSLSPWMRIQYMAPGAPFFFALVAVGMHRLERWRLGPMRIGAALVMVIVITHVYAGLWFATRYNRREPPPPGGRRAELVSWLEQQPGKHLLIVRYGPLHDAIQEWVFNDAEIDAAKVVFAREIASERNEPLLDYFKDRRAWLLEVDFPDTSDPHGTRSVTRLTPLR
jgi:hypothetical protein